jgi:hypothetical protein
MLGFGGRMQPATREPQQEGCRWDFVTRKIKASFRKGKYRMAQLMGLAGMRTKHSRFSDTKGRRECREVTRRAFVATKSTSSSCVARPFLVLLPLIQLALLVSFYFNLTFCWCLLFRYELFVIPVSSRSAFNILQPPLRLSIAPTSSSMGQTVA